MTQPLSDRDLSDRTWESWTVPTFVDIDGVPTAYRRAGSGPPLLYLHPGSGTRAWTAFHAALAEHYDVIAPEHPGYGDSERPEHYDGFEDMVLHYDAFFRALGLADFHLVGVSLGAWIAADLAIFYPERFRTLSLVTPLGARIPDEPLIDVFRFTPEQELDAVFNGRGERQLAALAQGDELDSALQTYRENTTSALLFFTPRYDYKLDHRLARITAPTLVVGADDDRVVGPFQAARFHDLIPGSAFVRIPGPDGAPSAHGVAFEQPADVVRAISDHIARTARRA